MALIILVEPEMVVQVALIRLMTLHPIRILVHFLALVVALQVVQVDLVVVLVMELQVLILIRLNLLAPELALVLVSNLYMITV